MTPPNGVCILGLSSTGVTDIDVNPPARGARHYVMSHVMVGLAFLGLFV